MGDVARRGDRVKSFARATGQRQGRRAARFVDDADVTHEHALREAGTYAKRFAAKEAFSKAVGTGFRRGVFMKDIGVVNARSGAPTLSLTGGAAIVLAEMVPPGHETRIHLTLTDDHPWAQAYVIIEALPQ